MTDIYRIRRFVSIGLSALLAACVTTRLPESAPRPRAPGTVAVPAPPSRPAIAENAANAANKPSASPAPVFDKGRALLDWVAQQERLYRIAAPLLIDNAASCPDQARNILGFTAKNKYSYSDDFVAEAESILGLGEQLQIMNVLPGSGAAQSGVIKGDILLAIEIEPLPQGPDAETDSAAIIGEEMEGRSSVTLTLLRDGERRLVDVPLTLACAMAVDLGNTDCVGSYADGRRVMITRGMMRAARSDDELAYMLARAIATNILAPLPNADMASLMNGLHSLRREANDGVNDSVIAHSIAGAPIDEDKIGELALFMLSQAGYSTNNVHELMERLSASCPNSTTAQ